MAAIDEFRKKEEKFFALVGYVISRWSYIDRSLFDFCRFALNTSERMTAIVFYRNPTIGDHLTLTDTLLQVSQIESRHLARWKLIVAEINKLLPFRNEIAHNPPISIGSAVVVVNRGNPSKSYVKDQKDWWEIQTEPKKLLRNAKEKSRQQVKIKSEDIREHLKKVDRLETAIAAVRWDLLGRPVGVGLSVPIPIFPLALGSD